jgi:hypothetical protein
VEGQDPTSPAGWYNDPRGRFEYRYFNGMRWTSDVSRDGKRYVDTPPEEPVRPPDMPRRSRGMAITAFVCGTAGVTLGWIPFVFAFAGCAAIVGIVFGVLGLNASKRQDGHGRGFAVAGLALSPIALAVCVGGFFFTRAVLHELRDFAEPGPHTLFVEQPCTIDGGRATLRGTIRNLDDRDHEYRLFVEFDTPDDSKSSTVAVRQVGPGETAPWTSSTDIAGSTVTCKVSGVFGPAPFGIDTQS